MTTQTSKQFEATKRFLTKDEIESLKQMLDQVKAKGSLELAMEKLTGKTQVNIWKAIAKIQATFE